MDLKAVGIGVGALGLLGAAFVLGGGLWLPREIRVSRSIDIAADRAAVHRYTGDLDRWDSWTPWTTREDATLKRSFEGKTDAVGGKMAWTGEVLGDGWLRLTATSPDAGVEYEMSLQGGQFPARGEIRYEPIDAGTRVTWTDTTDLGSNPLAHWFGPMIENYVGSDFADGLARLKTRAEDDMKAREEDHGKERQVPVDPALVPN